jgi:hypothetical protein
MPASSITKLPVAMRNRWLKKISANANAPGGTKKQSKGRARQDAAKGIVNTLGIYPIEAVVTGPQAASIGGPYPATITTDGGTPATVTVLAGNPPALVPVTWATPGTKNLVVTSSTPAAVGQADIVV